MKSDINLLYKRKIKKYSNKRIAVIVLLLALLAGGMYAGYAIPSGALSALKIQEAELNSKLNSSAETQMNLKEKAELKASLDIQLSELKAINEYRLDMSRYIDAVEKSLPTAANLTELLLTDEGISILGFAQSDEDIATFCLRLRQQNVFKDVYIESSTTAVKDLPVKFGITATLRTPLGNAPLIDAVEQIAAAPSAAPSQGAATAPAQEVTQK